MDDLKSSLAQYNEQLCTVSEALKTAKDEERESLLALQSELQELIQLTEESLDTVSTTGASSKVEGLKAEQNELDDEYALFMKEMAQCGAHESNSQNKAGSSKDSSQQEDGDSDIEDELATLLGMKCAVYHTHKWGGQPTLHNAMVSAVEPRQDDDQFNDLQVRVLYTHPTHSEMLPCPFYLDGECKFDDEKCRYSHGALVRLSNLKDAMEPDFSSIRVGSRVLLKIKPPDDQDISLTKKSSEKYHLWHRAVVRSVDFDKQTCIVKLEHGIKTGEKRKSISDEHFVKFEDIFPLNNENDEDSESDESLSDTEYPTNKSVRQEETSGNEHGRALLIEKSLQNNAPAMGEWERHTRGIGSKLMLAMGYVPGTGLGATGEGRVRPVEARVLPVGKSLDHCMAISEKAAAQDPVKVEQKLKRMQKREEERNKRAYEREKEKERRNVFNFLNRTLGSTPDESEPSKSSMDIKQSTSKDLNIEQFKIMEDTKKAEREIIKLNSSLSKYQPGTPGHRNINMQISEKNKELNQLRSKEREITKEQNHRKNKQKMTVF
ncbi:zinc finger CCCH-type with G patch domain-containing protein [Hyposmocoma kahamanoa]|uniref:zinc finger CCCH-type with G patch domain-containing protein n=1 Tax=Hyposmocoma kahamanoa TaxID=1477025 RepID=UPI000E6D6227|nr:zinc finger CCCH-type with G patch domain-containing protein [Hyposmocoma kahamanoa]